MRLIPHHQDDRHRREYRSPDGTWRVVRTRRPGGNRNERPRWEVHERPEAHAPWHCHAAFERRRDALVFLDTTVVTPGGESTAASAAPPKRSETPERQDEPPGSSQPRKPRRRITHDIDETRSGDGMLLTRRPRRRVTPPTALGRRVRPGPPPPVSLTA